jgi:hypothetical protein
MRARHGKRAGSLQGTGFKHYERLEAVAFLLRQKK